MSLTIQQIEEAKRHTVYTDEAYHEHPDCIRIAVAWLAAQKRLKHPAKKGCCFALKHVIESWAGRYISSSDVEVAAHLLGLKGEYPDYNFSRRLTRPGLWRLEGIESAMTMENYLGQYEDAYSSLETEPGKIIKAEEGHRGKQTADTSGKTTTTPAADETARL